MTEESLSWAVVEAVADREGVDAIRLRPRLYDVIDPEALDSLFRDGTGRLSFQYSGYVVTVDHTGAVRLEEGDAVNGSSVD